MFRSYHREDLKLVLISLGNWDVTGVLASSGAKVFVLSSRRVRPRTALEIAGIAKAERADLIVSQGVVGNFYGRVASAVSRVPNLVIVHSLLSSDYANPWIRKAYELLEKTMRRFTRHYVVVSGFLKSALIEAGVPADRVTLVYNGVGLKAMPAKTAPLGTGTRIVLGSMGRLHEVKNYYGLISAMSLLDSSVCLVIWGEGEERGRLEEIISIRGLEDRVTLAGWSGSLEHVLSTADVYVQTSFSEGFGMAVVEAMLAAKPIVVTPGGSLPEIIDDGRTGIVSDGFSAEEIAAAIMRMLEREEAAREMAEAACEEAQNRFSVETWASRISAVLVRQAQ
ncbi:MAG: glycosyltransferase family 4 protein [Actinobacteria bacterium]|nr:glycosyltransferase family 4 protein [Actinomycetota bacterium]